MTSFSSCLPDDLLLLELLARLCVTLNYCSILIDRFLIQTVPRRLGGEGIVGLLRDVTGCILVLVLAVASTALQVLLLSSFWDVVALLLEHGVCVHLIGKEGVS